jgi:hypothetical protein
MGSRFSVPIVPPGSPVLTEKNGDFAMGFAMGLRRVFTPTPHSTLL